MGEVMTRLAFTSQSRAPATLAIASIAFALSLSVSHTAMAACNGSVASPNSAAVTVLCNGVGADGAGTPDAPYVVPPDLIDSTTTSTAGNSTLLQFDGHGRVLENSGSIINELNGAPDFRNLLLLDVKYVRSEYSWIFMFLSVIAIAIPIRQYPKLPPPILSSS